MTALTIGDLDQRVTLEAPARTPDDGGGATVSWSAVADVWAAIRPSSGAERVEADALRGRLTHEIWIRHRDGVTPEMRFVLGARVFDIRAVLEAGERRSFFRCLVEERVP